MLVLKAYQIKFGIKVIFLLMWIMSVNKAKLKKGEGKLKSFDLDIGHAKWRRKMVDDDTCSENEKYFENSFYNMENKVDKLF